jgi:DNA-binding CsgD family transcriptional regulator
LATLFFSWELWSDVFGLRTTPIPWELSEFIQTFASIGLILGTGTGLYFLRASELRIDRLGSQMQAATGNYQSHLEKLFKGWDLSGAERAVAVYAMKGFSNAEIADLRQTSVATIKSQMNAIFRKAGLDNRQQLIAYLVEELLSGVALQPVAD